MKSSAPDVGEGLYNLKKQYVALSSIWFSLSSLRQFPALLLEVVLKAIHVEVDWENWVPHSSESGVQIHFIEVQYNHLASKLHLCKLQTLYTHFIHFIHLNCFKEVSKLAEGMLEFESKTLWLGVPLTAVDLPQLGTCMGDQTGCNRRYSCPTDILLPSIAGWLKGPLFYVSGTFHGWSLNQHAGLLMQPDVLFHRLIILDYLSYYLTLLPSSPWMSYSSQAR